jgi:hypothetical protein
LVDRASGSVLLLHEKAETELPKSAFEIMEVLVLNLAINGSL